MIIVKIKFLLTATALNLKKMVKMLDVEAINSKLSKKISDIIQAFKNIFRKLNRVFNILKKKNINSEKIKDLACLNLVF